MEKRERIKGLDYMRILASFMVVVLHASVARGSENYVLTSSVIGICDISVPLFFMISGAVHLRDSVIPISELFQKKIPKLAIPFIVWSLFYTSIRIAAGKLPLHIRSFLSLLWEPAYYQFWFLYTLLAIYLLLPAIQAVALRLSKRQLEYVLGLWAVFTVVIPCAQRYLPGFEISEHVDLVLCEGYIGYFLLGHYLTKYPPQWKTGKIGALYLAGVACTIAEGYLTWKCDGYWYCSYLTVGTLSSSVGAFVLLVLFGGKVHRADDTAYKLSAMTMDIYYIHMLVLVAVEKMGLTGKNNTLLLYVKALVVFALSTFGAWILYKVKQFLRKGKQKG